MNSFNFDNLDSTQKYILIGALVLGLILILPYAGIHIFSAPASPELPGMAVQSQVPAKPYQARVPEEKERPTAQAVQDRKLSDIEKLLR